jgi:hypothetical protein
MADVEPFDKFLARTAAARPEDYLEALRAAGESAPADAAAEFERMKAYVLGYYEGVRPVRSYLDSLGRPWDCVPFEQQPSVRAAHAAGLKVPAAPPHAAARSDSGGVHPPAPCPKGSVPILRVTLEHLVQFGTLDNYFQKGPPPSPPAGGPRG